MFNAIFINVTIISWGQYYYWEKTEYTEKPTDQLDHKRLYWVHPNSTDAARLLRQCWYAPISEEDVNLTTTRLRLWRLPLLSPKFTWKYLCIREIILLRYKDKGHLLTSAVYPWKIGAVCDDKNTNVVTITFYNKITCHMHNLCPWKLLCLRHLQSASDIVSTLEWELHLIYI